jgi:hypothetical protein
MLSLNKKIAYLETSLNKHDGNYADNFKEDIIIFIDEFDIKNERLNFLTHLVSYTDIDSWIEKLTSRMILKFDSESEQISDFIFDYIEHG